MFYPELHTPRLLLRRFKKEDARDLFSYLSDPEVVRFEPYSPMTLSACKNEAARRSEDGAYIAVCLKEGPLIGNLYVASGSYSTCEIGYVLNRAYWRKGYGEESVRALLRHLFMSAGVRRVVARCSDENIASWRLLEKLGFRKEGHFLKELYFKKKEDGSPAWMNTLSYAMLYSDYIKITGTA